MRFEITKESEQKLAAACAVMPGLLAEIGVLLQSQVLDRFAKQGSPEQQWPEKKLKQWGYNDGRSILTGTTASLRRSFEIALEPDNNRVAIGSSLGYAWVQQHGKKNIQAVHAKAMFIPITDRAINSSKPAADPRAFRMYKKARRVKGQIVESYHPLVPGKLINNKLHIKDDNGDYIEGVPDFIFLSKVTVPPRPMLPDTKVEQTEIKNHIAEHYDRQLKGQI
jgi:phage gpG-like protein